MSRSGSGLHLYTPLAHPLFWCRERVARASLGGDAPIRAYNLLTFIFLLALLIPPLFDSAAATFSSSYSPTPSVLYPVLLFYFNLSFIYSIDRVTETYWKRVGFCRIEWKLLSNFWGKGFYFCSLVVNRCLAVELTALRLVTSFHLFDRV